VKSGTMNKWHRGWHIAVGRHEKPKKLTWGDCGFRRKLAAACRKVPHRARVAWCKRDIVRNKWTRAKVERGIWGVWMLRERVWTCNEGRKGMKNLGAGQSRYLRKWDWRSYDWKAWEMLTWLSWKPLAWGSRSELPDLLLRYEKLRTGRCGGVAAPPNWKIKLANSVSVRRAGYVGILATLVVMAHRGIQKGEENLWMMVRTWTNWNRSGWAGLMVRAAIENTTPGKEGRVIHHYAIWVRKVQCGIFAPCKICWATDTAAANTRKQQWNNEVMHAVCSQRLGKHVPDFDYGSNSGGQSVLCTKKKVKLSL
jgi:hypothetical protein